MLSVVPDNGTVGSKYFLKFSHIFRQGLAINVSTVDDGVHPVAVQSIPHSGPLSNISSQLRTT